MVSQIKDTAALQQQLDALVDRFASRQRQVHHVVLGVARADGSFRWSKAVGDARPGGPPLRPDTPYFVASVTKLFIVSTALLLHERSELSLDDSIAAHLPGEVIAGLHRLDGVDRTEQITVRHLLSHTSGLADYFEGKPRGGRSLVDRLVHEGDFAFDLADVIRLARDELSPRFPPQPVQAEKQKAFYSDTNYALACAIIESATGRPLAEAYADLVLRPLGLRRTWLHGRSQPLATVAEEPAAIWFSDRVLELDQAMRSFAEDGLISTIDDQLRFLGAVASGELFADPATPALMQQRWNRIWFPFEYGLGMMRLRMPRAMTGGRRLPPLVGHAGASGSWLFHCPDLDLLLAGTLDQLGARSLPYRLLPRVLRLVQKASG